MRKLAALFPVLTVLACGGDSGDGDGDGDEPDAGIASSDWMFEPDHLLLIDIEAAESDWDAVRTQTRNVLEIFGPTCGIEAYGSPFTERPADVTIDGRRLGNIGFRKKGFLGSLDDQKPSLKLDFDEYVPGQRLDDAKRMTLNNAKQDPSYLNQCLGYALFNQAGVPAPRCNFAAVTVNGRDLGVYVHVEAVKKPFLARHFDDDSGNLYEGTLSDFRPGWTVTFDRKTNESVPPGSEDRSDIDALAAALAISDDAAMVAEVERLVDVDRFLSFWALETMTSHWDGYSGNNNNFYLYADPGTGKFVFMPWGADALFGNATATHDAAATRSLLTQRLYLHAPTRQRYLDRYDEILATVWDDGALAAEVSRMEALIGDSVLASATAAFADGLAALRSGITGREAILRQGWTAAGPGDADPLLEPFCFDDVGPATSTFSAAYNGGGSSAVTLDVSINGTPRPLSNLSTFIGSDNDKPGFSVVIAIGNDAGGREVISLLSLPTNELRPGAREVGKGLIEAFLLFRQPGNADFEEIYFLGGTLNFTAAGSGSGAPVAGSLDLSVWDAPFF